MPIDAISLDLDDTLWPIAPTIEAADRALAEWMAAHAPRAAAALPIPAMRALRDQVFAEHPELGHDFTTLRMITLRRALLPHGYSEDAVAGAFEAFFSARQRVELYADVQIALERLAARWPLVSLTNGNACLTRIGLKPWFRAEISSRQHGKAKPDPSIFHAACQAAGSTPARTLHIGDHPEQDVLGALRAGMPAVWLNRHGQAWTHGEAPTRVCRDLHEVVDWLEQVLATAA